MISADALFRIGDAAEDAGDLDLALRSFQRGAELEDEACLSRLAYLHDEGHGVRPNKKRALRLYLKAWRNGSHVAANNIAILYREIGNARGMVRWFTRAIDRNDDGARIEVAKLYLSGDGVEQSADIASRHLAAALSSVHLSEMEREEAEALRDRLRPRIVVNDS